MRVDRSAEGDTITIQRAVEKMVAEFSERLPDGVTAQLTQTRSQNIIDRLNLLVHNGLFGLGLVLAFLFLFLSSRTAFLGGRRDTRGHGGDHRANVRIRNHVEHDFRVRADYLSRDCRG